MIDGVGRGEWGGKKGVGVVRWWMVGERVSW